MIGYVLTYRDKIKEIIQSSAAAKALSTHRDWQGVIGNVVIALTGIGLIALAIKTAYSKAVTGEVSLFFDTHATQKTEKLAEKLILTSK
ncbi:hypothetical protein [Piscirickettsia salmonis]|uniref:Uncharacterized protein n=1 Tax=Piscirickettsia salmonis TaxID=1238 RepID=A0A9Q6LK22_PISSA|nr:hypothetical protein [Piscirickettsia salmonis]ALA24328.1 ankyrin [Piscirickettsia salmonis]ERL61301.1 hypothetical protein K661_02364 [Piscirickettsia salmonis LF-89 = ATCC VR-1361]QGN76698.1 hypothetical protein Psal001_00888 [Piscirickettsia salmonis]QGN80288.1 hypothetical protein Psal002_00913 [Piscirickettsia salmonis]QGN85440.1 hypothetical protein Psal003_02519 [Piscirickettsia salmonis]